MGDIPVLSAPQELYSTMRLFRVSHNESMILFGDSEGTSVGIWDIHARKCITRMGYGDHRIYCASFSADDAWVTTAATGATVDIWDVATRTSIYSIDATDIICGNYAPGEKLVALVRQHRDHYTGRYNAYVILIDLRTNTIVHLCTMRWYVARECTFTLDDSTLCLHYHHQTNTSQSFPIPHTCLIRHKLLLIIMISHRPGFNRLKLPDELWDWMFDQRLM